MELLKVKNISKKFGKKMILEDISFSINKGEIVGFLGPNGSGKTTTIKTILGLIKPSAGAAYINGLEIYDNYEECMKKVGAIVEMPEMYKWLSGYDNLKVLSESYGKRINKEKIDETLKLVGLEGRGKDKIKNYSLGMKQRLGIAQAIIHDPELIILDEPTNGLDPKGIRELRDTLKQQSHVENRGVLVSSHLLSEMELLCDRIIYIKDGKIIDTNQIRLIESYNYKLDDINKGIELLISNNIEYELNDTILKIIVSEEVTAKKITKLFVLNDVDILELNKQSLEDNYLSITK